MRSAFPLFAAAALLAACGQRSSDSQERPDNSAAARPSDAAPAPPTTTDAAPGATVQLAPTQGHHASGTLRLSAQGSAVRLSGSIGGLPPNAEFGFHIHEKGDCSAPDASSAGGHFNPANAQHGDPSGGSHHAGDLPNAKSDAQGAAQVDAQATDVTIGSGQPDDVLGRAVVLHEKADDYSSQPAGNSGARIACGVIAGGRPD